MKVSLSEAQKSLETGCIGISYDSHLQISQNSLTRFDKYIESSQKR